MRAVVLLVAFAAACVASTAALKPSSNKDFVSTLPLGKYELFEYDSTPDSAAVVTSEHARFTVLTDRVIRMEYSSSMTFEDRPTMAFLNRKLPVPKFTSYTGNGETTITTSALKLTYKVGQPFSADSLSITSMDSTSAFKSWQYGQANPGNLLGTIRSLDELNVISLNCTQNAKTIIHDEGLHCAWGLVSRDGWTVVDDSKNVALDYKMEWWDGYNGDVEDLYFFGHGHDFKGAIADFTQIAGKTAMIPRFASGIWWTRWYDLNADDVMKLVYDYGSRDIPLDVFVLDMDWHTKYGWGGYTFDEHLFPFPSDTLGYLKEVMGLHFLVNLHDDDGVRATEKMHSQMAAALGLPASTGTIPFSIVNKTYMYALEDIVLGDVMNQGVYAWWTDWQQGGTQGGAAGGYQNPTIMLNKQRGTERLRRGDPTRAMNLARWGGLGSHRYQVGFSGDVAALTWSNLAFQPYFSLTAANVGYGFWSHDIEGPADDHEMYVRWVQWASFSGVFRSHDRGMSAGSCYNADPVSCSNVRVWEIPTKYFEANRDAMRYRETLIPYLYTLTRAAYDTGVGPLYPMYYDWPEEEMAYAADPSGNFAQYMLGEDLLVAPIVAPANTTTQVTTKSVWLPPGCWFEIPTGTQRCSKTSVTVERDWDLTEIPIYARAGAIIPTIPLDMLPSTVGVARRQYDVLAFDLIPGATSGSTTVYEDDGLTTAYVSGKFAETKASYTVSGQVLTFSVSTSGSFTELPSTRTYVLRLPNTMPPSKVTVGSATVPYSRYPSASAYWTYDGVTLATVIVIPGVSVSSTPTTVTATLGGTSPSPAVLSGMRGAFYHANLAKRNFDETRTTLGAHLVVGGKLMDAAKMGAALTFLAGTNTTQFAGAVSSYRSAFIDAQQEVQGMEPKPAPPVDALAQYYDSSRNDHILCGTRDCEFTNAEYQQIRVEGYQPSSSASGTEAFNDYWSAANNDNWATTASTAPPGYADAVFKNGIVFTSQVAGTIPLDVYYNDDLKDHMTLATQESRSYAEANGYKPLHTGIGYIYANPPSDVYAVDAVQMSRWQYSNAILNASFD